MRHQQDHERRLRQTDRQTNKSLYGVTFQQNRSCPFVWAQEYKPFDQHRAELLVKLLKQIKEDRQYMSKYNMTFRSIGVTILAVEKQLSTTYSQRVYVALVIQHARSMRRIKLSSVAPLAILYLSTLSHKRHHFLCKFCLKYFSL